ncbi:MAG: hypothetical protein J6A28_00390 [Clostridia bacterium]|nr:hypothetical protein [Clostridia bacterium]
MNNYKIKLQLQDLEITISNMYITCYGAVSLLDFKYHLTLELKSFKNKTIIITDLSDDIAFLYEFCTKGTFESPTNECIFSIYNFNNKASINLETSDCKFLKETLIDENTLQDFFLELKSYFEFLIENYKIEHPDNN